MPRLPLLSLVLAFQSLILAQSAPKILPDGKTLTARGRSVQVNSMPTTLVVSRDGRYVVSLNNGFGTVESGFRQSLSVLDLRTNALVDYPDDRLKDKARQTYFIGLAFSGDGKHLYASMSSMSDAEGEKKDSTGNGIAVYSFADGVIAPERFIKIHLQPLAAGKTAAKVISKMPAGKVIPFPAGLAVIPARGDAGERILVADNLSDDALLIDAASGEELKRFDLSTDKIIPAAYPYNVVVTKDGKRAYVSLWNASRVAELDLVAGKVNRMIDVGRPSVRSAAGSHPTAMVFDKDEKYVYVALANRDAVTAIDVGTGVVAAKLATTFGLQKYLGASPTALALSEDGRRLYVANAGADSVAMFELRSVRVVSAPNHTVLLDHAGPTGIPPSGLITTEWYPQALATRGDEVIIASGKGRGTVPNNLMKKVPGSRKPFPYILSLVHGSLERVNTAGVDWASSTSEAAANIHAGEKFSNLFEGRSNPIKHVIYIIKENRTYDQVLGDLEIGNGDKSLTMYGEEITPNQHKLAREFGLLDNFYDSGEVSGDGHNWSTSATGGDYLEKTIPLSYRGKERNYDYEGEVNNRVPLDDDMPDVNETGTGYIWGAVARRGLTYRHYGEFILTGWCNQEKSNASPMEGSPWGEGSWCKSTAIKKGEPLPTILGYPPNTPSPYPWDIPLVAKNTATKRELRGHYDEWFPDFELAYPDQLRADEFLREFKGFVANRGKGARKELPNYVLLRLGNDHTSGTKAGVATPAAAVADNDLAVGRVVDAVSHSSYWDDTAVLILEDDAQDGPDHVDAHRSTAFVISKYSPSRAEKPFVEDQFYCTVSMLRTIEALLGIVPMNANDASASPIRSLFSGDGTHPAFTADYRNRDNGLLYQVNKKTAPGAKESAEMDFTHADRADAARLNEILWRDRMGDKPMPESRQFGPK